MSILPGPLARLLAGISTTAAVDATSQPAASNWLALIVFVAAGLGLVLAWRWGVFRRGSINGPLQFESGQSSVPFFGIALTGFLAGQMFAAVYGAAVLSPPPAATQPTSASTNKAPTIPATAPSTAPVQGALSPASRDDELNLTPAQDAKCEFGMFAFGLAIMLFITGLRPGGLKRLGLTIAGLPRGIATGLVAAIAVVPWTMLCVVAVFAVWPLIAHEMPQNHPMLVELHNATDPHVRWLIAATALIVAPMAEEIIFRGSLQQGLCLITRRPWLAVALTSLIFGFLHPYLWMVVPLFLLSMCLGYIYQRTGNLWATITIHAVFNGVSVFAQLYGSG
jgi:membrane protease YdiL (CAAX protease family)